MADGVVTKGTQALTVLGLTVVPAFGGQFVSALAKVGSDKLRDTCANNAAAEFGVDLAGGAVVAGLECGAAALIGGKATAMRVLPYAGAGALLGAVLPQLDKVIDGAVRRLVSKATGGDLPASTEAAPGGEVSSTLRALPGGRGPSTRDAYYTRSERLKAPGGYTVNANQSVPVPMSKRLRW